MRRLALFRSRLAPLLLLLPALLIASSDMARRWSRFSTFSETDRLKYAFSLAESVALWGSLLFLVARRRGAMRWLATGLFVLLGALALGSERYFYDQFETYLNADAVLFGAAFPASLRGQLAAQISGLTWALTVPFLFFVAIAVAARKWLRPGRTRSRVATVLAPAMVGLVCVIPCSFRTVQAATPDVIWFHALGGLVGRLAHGSPSHVEPGIRRPPYMPVLAAVPRAPRNVLFVLTESVRFDATCVEYDAACKRTPFTNEMVRDRFPLLQMRSNSSTTAISFGVILSGLRPTETRDAIHTAPLLLDYAHAAGYDTAYWTSQNLMFAHSDQFVRDLPVSHRCGATDLDPDADIDMGAKDSLLTERVKRELPALREPWFAMVHYSSTHFPYRIIPGDEPFQPADSSKSPDDNGQLFNYYQNAVYAQDRTIADLVGSVRGLPAGPRTVVIFTSDHGEAFREHGQLGHTGSVFDEEVHVPAWIDAPPGTLAPSERAALVADKNAPLWHLDLTPTILDLLGVWSLPELGRTRSAMSGTSLLGSARTHVVVPLTNCSELWGCAFRNWGVMRDTLKVEAREWDYDWHCWDVVSDPHEQHDLGAEACGELRQSANTLMGSLPRSANSGPGRLSQEE